jgi:hypothetical protein
VILYCVTARFQVFDDGWSKIVDIPTFYLNPTIQGITDERHAIEIAKEIINPTDDMKVHLGIYVQKVEIEELTNG